MEFYYAVFTKEDDNILVSIPDVEICETFGKTWDEAYEMGVDALAACLSETGTTVHPKSSREKLQKEYPGTCIVPMTVNAGIRKKYGSTKRLNVIFPEDLLIKVDEYHTATGMKRSQLLTNAAKQYLENRA